MKSAGFDPGNYTFEELLRTNDKRDYQVAYDKWIAVYGSHFANLFKSYAMSHNGDFMPEDIAKEVKEECRRVANLATGLKQ